MRVFEQTTTLNELKRQIWDLIYIEKNLSMYFFCLLVQQKLYKILLILIPFNVKKIITKQNIDIILHSYNNSVFNLLKHHQCVITNLGRYELTTWSREYKDKFKSSRQNYYIPKMNIHPKLKKFFKDIPILPIHKTHN